MPVKVTINLPEEVVEALKKIAEERKTTVTHVMRQALENDRFLREEVNQGSKVLIEKPEGTLRQVILPN